MNSILHLERKFCSKTETFIVNQINSITGFDLVIGSMVNTGNFSIQAPVIIPDKLSFLAQKAIYLDQSTMDNLFDKLPVKDIKLIHTHYLVDAYYFAKFTERFHVPKICSVYGYDVSSFPNMYFGHGKQMLQKIFEQYDAFLAMSEDMKKDLISLGCPEHKVIIHYYGTDTKRFYNNSRDYGAKKPLNILTVGTVEEKKAQHLVIDALQHMIEKTGYREFKYHIVGGGDFISVVQKRIDRYGLRDNVILHGFVPHNDPKLLELYNSADIFIHPSITLSNNDKEGIPGTIVEAMANGLPVISTTHAGIPYAIAHNEDGYLYPERDVEGLANGIYKLCQDSAERERLGRNAQLKAKNSLDLQANTKNLERIYREFCSKFYERPTVLHVERKYCGPTETFINNQVNLIKGFDVVIGTLKYIKSFNTNVPVVTPLALNAISRDARMLSKETELSLLKELNKFKVQLVHTHYLVDALLFYRFLDFFDVPKVVSAYGYDVASFPQRNLGLNKFLLALIFRKYNYILAMSEDMKKDIMALGCPEEKILIHYHGINTSRFINPERCYQVAGRKFRILSVGSLVEKKGHKTLIKALGRLREKNITNFEARIVGEGEQRNELLALIKELHLTEYVQLAGYIPHESDQLIAEYKKADIFILPSNVSSDGDKEGIPGTIVEAMACGLPVISTLHAGIPCIIKDGVHGFLVPEHDWAQIADRITQYVESESLRTELGKNAAKKALTELDVVECTKRLESIYRKVLTEYFKR
jgi:colanic acid/amylovoran biosynthesis glycosyltransferase